MFDRFSDAARLVVTNAEKEARLLGHGYVGTEHLLLGLLTDRDSGAGRSLSEAGVTPAACRSKVREAVGEADAASVAGPELPMSERAKRALGRAGRLANRRRDEFVQPGHILLSIIEVEGRSGQVLRGLSVDVGVLEQAVVSRMDNEPQPASTTQAPEHGSEPELRPCRCGSCGSALEDTLTHQVLTSRHPDDPRQFTVAYCSSCGTAVGSVGT